MPEERLPSVLAKQRDADQRFGKLSSHVQRTFDDNRERFDGLTITRQKLNEEDANEYPDETKIVETTVKQECLFIKGAFAQAVDLSVQRQMSNANAKCVITLFGEEQELNYYAMVDLLKHLQKLKQICSKVPSQDGSKEWEKFDDERGLFKSQDPEVRFSSRKVPYNHVKHPGDGKHPPQVEVLQRDERFTKNTVTFYTGKISTNEKSHVLARIDKAISAVNEGMQRATNMPAASLPNIGDHLFNSIVGNVIN